MAGLVGNHVDGDVDYLAVEQPPDHIRAVGTVEVGEAEEQCPAPQAGDVAQRERGEVNHDIGLKGLAPGGYFSSRTEVGIVRIMDMACGVFLHHHGKSTVGERSHCLGSQWETLF